MPDLLIVNQLEHEVVSRGKLVAVTYGAEGAALFEDGRRGRTRSAAARRMPSTGRPRATPSPPASSSLCSRAATRSEALRRACAAGALAASRLGAQPSLPTAARAGGDTRGMTPIPIILDCDPGSRRRDRDPARARLARARARRRDDRRPATRRSRRRPRTRYACSSSPAAPTCPCTRAPTAPFVRDARRRRARPRRDLASTGPTCRRRRRAAARSTPSSSSPSSSARRRSATLVATGPLTNVGLLFATHADARPDRIVLMGGAIGEGNRTPAAEFNIWADPEAAQRVFAEQPRHDDGRPRRHPPRADHATSTPSGCARRAGRPRRRRADRLLRALPQGALPGSRRLADARPRLHRAPGRPDAARRPRRRSSRSTAPPARAGAARTSTGADREHFGPPNAKVALDIDGERFAELVVERISSLG